jgi:hypothetical protein
VVLVCPLCYGGFDGFCGLVFDVDGFCCSGHYGWVYLGLFLWFLELPLSMNQLNFLLNYINHFLTDLIRLWTYFVFGSKLFIA